MEEKKIPSSSDKHCCASSMKQGKSFVKELASCAGTTLSIRRCPLLIHSKAKTFSENVLVILFAESKPCI